MNPVTASQRAELAELMGKDSLFVIESSVMDYIDAHTDENGKVYGPPARWKKLSAVIRLWWRRDQQKRGVVQIVAPRPKETPNERLERAQAIWMMQVRERNNWITSAQIHTHRADCQFGEVCAYQPSKEPVIPMLAEILEKLSNA